MGSRGGLTGRVHGLMDGEGRVDPVLELSVDLLAVMEGGLVCHRPQGRDDVAEAGDLEGGG